MSNTNDPCIVAGKCASPTNMPEFIDTSACLCGLLQSKQSDPNGGINELWRCIGNASANINDGENGKWWNTTLPSAELSGINQPQNWGQNGPDLSSTFVLVDVNGKPTYQQLPSSGSPSLVGNDSKCTGKNDTQLSTTFYGNAGKGNSTSSSSGMSSSSASSSMSSMSSASSAASSASSSASSAATASTTASGTTPASTAGSSTSSSSTSSSSAKSDANRGGLKAIFLVGMLLAPLVTFMA